MAKSGFALTRNQIDTDRLGALKQQIAALQAEHDKIETRLRKREGTVTGLNFKITVYDSTGKQFNFARAKRLLGAATYDKCWTPTEYRTSRVTEL